MWNCQLTPPHLSLTYLGMLYGDIFERSFKICTVNGTTRKQERFKFQEWKPKMD
jgi:hypothetical protein